MKNADEGKSARSIEINIDLAGQSLHQKGRTIVVQASPSHVDSLDLGWVQPFNGVIIAFADLEIIAYQTPEGDMASQI